ncbi:MAG: hypothetical protein Q8933_00580 [Bacteroidota bacterium]|nr:hypothetical protein [Bacteroidota bacterium]MDP4195421.1 hypothetical protein [Bacteroidota bacterium]
MIQIILSGIVSSVAAALIISGFKFLSKTISKNIKHLEDNICQLQLKIDYLEIKHEALVLALHNYFHNGFYVNYKNELERLSDDYNFLNKNKQVSK